MSDRITKRKHTECLFDICNFGGSNAGAWADLYGDDLVVFAGMWHGSWTSHLDPSSESCYDLQLWVPGTGPKERLTHRLSTGEVYMDSSMNSSVTFGAIGDVSAIIRAFEDPNELRIEPEHFKGCDILSWSECAKLIR